MPRVSISVSAPAVSCQALAEHHRRGSDDAGARNPMIAASDGTRLVGYARVSTQDQDLALQIDALLKCGVAKDLIFTDKASGATHQRPGLDTCLAKLRDGDVLLVWRLDRLGRSVRRLV
jgi:predicted site-specific integrase-resolvase